MSIAAANQAWPSDKHDAATTAGNSTPVEAFVMYDQEKHKTDGAGPFRLLYSKVTGRSQCR